ncbi:MAG TPA: bifunctional riboflavin kinase/FAD synthetase [Steroidobacteraceae bacterium]|nr:bifunctional riboflavin kinase/FAD synthetase [Steroidobacteraceae bacterium]
MKPTIRSAWGNLHVTRPIEIVRGVHNLRDSHRGCVATIGNFDGVHRGHQKMLDAVRTAARDGNLPATLITFEPTPREYFERDKAPARLMRMREKLEALARYGIDRVVVLRFDERMRNMTADEFESDLLAARLGVRHIVVGDDFRYARHRQGTIDTLRTAGVRHGFTVEQIPAFAVDGRRVSSSLVRDALGRGDMDDAARLLGRPYRMSGRVRQGARLGRTLGYPTANLALHRQVIPLWGILAVRVSGPGLDDHPAVVSLGTRPTVNGTEPLLEVHVFDFDGDLYGQYLYVDFFKWLRAERKFESLEALVEQMNRDAQQARAALTESAVRSY